MKRNENIINRGILLSLLCVGVTAAVLPQFTPDELKNRDRWEKFLVDAEIVEREQMLGSRAVTNPWRLVLRLGEVEQQALWKNPDGRVKGFLEGWRWEIAAYRVDKYLGLNMVPPTMERRFNGNRGSIQLWVDAEMDLRKMMEEEIRVPSYKRFYWNRAIYLQRAFDNLIANEDRHAGNILITKDWRMILIDHSRSFRSSRKFTKELIYTKKHPQGPKEMKQLPRSFVAKLKSLDFTVLSDVAGEYLQKKEIEAMLKRKDLILKEIDDLIEKMGEDQILY